MAKERLCEAAVCSTGCILLAYYHTWLNTIGTPHQEIHWKSLFSQLELARSRDCPNVQQVTELIDRAFPHD